MNRILQAVQAISDDAKQAMASRELSHDTLISVLAVSGPRPDLGEGTHYIFVGSDGGEPCAGRVAGRVASNVGGYPDPNSE